MRKPREKETNKERGALKMEMGRQRIGIGNGKGAEGAGTAAREHTVTAPANWGREFGSILVRMPPRRDVDIGWKFFSNASIFGGPAADSDADSDADSRQQTVDS